MFAYFLKITSKIKQILLWLATSHDESQQYGNLDETAAIQPNTLYQIVVRYLTDTPHSPAYPVAQVMTPDLLLPQDAQEHLENLANEVLGAYAPWLNGIVPRTALAILWLATHRQDVEPMVAQGLIAAAGLRGKQNWALILSSSARVSEVTYETVVAVRYPELDADAPHTSGFRKLPG